jgi:glyoxylase-like metal-dependent hydrolase (beta-lactamase superfamily II)
MLRYARYPRNLPIAARMLARGLWRPRRIGEVSLFGDEAPDVPGAPALIPCPGHTLGHVAFHFSDRDALICGDALVTLDPYTGRTGPRLMARASMADSQLALESLSALEATGARIVLGGHGEPWTEGVDAAAEHARRAGSA